MNGLLFISFLTFISDYLPEIQAEYYRSQQKEVTKEKMTILMIAHWLKTVRHADKILVIDDGKIVQSGTNKQLLEQSGIYH